MSDGRRVRRGARTARFVSRCATAAPAFPRAERERIFEPFFTRTHGTGLGLAVARRVVELHGGHDRREQHADGGAVFSIALPGGSPEWPASWSPTTRRASASSSRDVLR